jgi:hypothetical protein
MRLAALAFALLLLPPLPLAAQTANGQGAPGQTQDGQTPEEQAAAREKVLAAFKRLVDRGEARTLFGLPVATFWRREGALAVALLADDAEALRPVLQGAAAPFAAASAREIAVVASGPAALAGRRAAELAPEADLVIVVAPRPLLAELAAASDFSMGMLARFELGTWPFMFRFQPDERRRGVVLLADDEPARAREASFILATVWGLGGVTLGPELTGLVSDSDSGPQLTPLGEAVFRLMFHPDLDAGMPLAEAVRRAETLLPR